ncbi:MAG TPA: hypothetical protein VKR32_17420, partial [Puia sp.]|nr:hypothetical protein [Puia sp.]
KLFLFSRDMADSDPSWNKEFSVILSLADSKRIPVYLVTADEAGAMNYLTKNGLLNNIILLRCDATAIKTAARVNPTLFLLKQANILEKWGAGDFENSLADINVLPMQ